MTTLTRAEVVFRLEKVTQEEWLGNNMGTARASWNLLLNERRVAHIYHNRDEWVYRLASNPYVLHRGGRKNRNQIVDEIKQSVSENHSRVRFWVSDDWESRSKYLETENGRLALITAVNWGGDDIWIATMMFGDHRREFDSLYKAVEWATQKARRWLESN